jgi:hypothetical protein
VRRSGKIILSDWNLGFNKVAHTKLLLDELGYSLLYGVDEIAGLKRRQIEAR